jgi:hypothetical protein
MNFSEYCYEFIVFVFAKPEADRFKLVSQNPGKARQPNFTIDCIL